MIQIKGGKIIDPKNGVSKTATLHIRAGKIVSADELKGKNPTVIDAKGKLVVPGLIDMHVHLREPGEEYKETIVSGLKAAAAGGFTGVASMPNTKPVTDNAAIIDFLLRQASIANGARLFPMGAITKNLAGEELAEFADMMKAGAVAFTDDGKGLANPAVMRAALEYAQNLNVTICAHAEEMRLSAGGHMHEGLMSTKLGLAGIPSLAESLMVGRDLQLLEYTQGRYHVQHISTKESVELVRQAKKKGLQVTAEAAPHHWTLLDEALENYDTHFKMNPPLRSKEHVKAVVKGLKDGTIDCIATDHAPHSELEKKLEFDQALNGIIGLETALPLALDLVREGVLDYDSLIEKMSVNPAKILGIDKGALSVGMDADVTIIDPDLEWTFTKEENHSKSENSPWLDKPMKGRAVCTIVSGKVVYQL